MKQYTEPYSTPYYDELNGYGIRLPAVLCPIRTIKGRELRRHGIEVFRNRFLTPRTDGMSNTITSVQKDNLIMIKTNDNMENLVYHEHPTKEQLLEYFSRRIRVRKMTPREAFRLMDVDDEDIEKIQAYPFKTYAEREEAIAKADKKELARIKRESICKTAQLRLAGNSIVCSVILNIFRTLFIPDQPENKQPIQKSLFDI